MGQQRAQADASKRASANAFFNQIPWVADDVQWGRRDYWATPIEMLGANGGDCEDYSIAKYLTLAQMQVPAGKLRITYVRAPRLRQAHMVLAYYESPNADPWILDNLESEIRRGSQRRDLTPVYSFNAAGLWKAKARGAGHRVGGARRLKLWSGLLSRLETQLRASSGS